MPTKRVIPSKGAKRLVKSITNYFFPLYTLYQPDTQRSARGPKARGLILVSRAYTGCNKENGMHFFNILRNHISKKCAMHELNEDLMKT